MKIDTYLNGILEKYTKQSKPEKTDKVNIKENTGAQTTPANKGIDKVEISPKAKLISELLGSENINAQKLQEIKARIENGTYKPPINEIAKSILKEWKGE